ncbi:hypothetical protein CFI10_04120 [Marinobacterium iners]|uniref:hypothetical protein n=1 Tax=Marinobacterium iners TaxID=48076 RepID=UPI001A8E0626|nr:hypothetical protein [Marinobacterium iners]QSR34180.1 hypothetical protein CFI10_04120 [Marinobacterium iners]
MPFPLIWVAVAGVIAAGTAAAAYYSDSGSSSSSGSDNRADEEARRQRAANAEKQRQARIKRVHAESRRLLAAELTALGASGHLMTPQIIAFGQSTMASPKGSGKQLINNLTHMDVGTESARMQMAHLLTQIDLGEPGLPAMESAVNELIARTERLKLMRQIEAQLRSGARLDELCADAIQLIPDV